MSWIALMDPGATACRTTGLPASHNGVRGSLVVELSLCASRNDPFIAFASGTGIGSCRIVLSVDPLGVVRLEVSHGGEQRIMAAKSGTSQGHRHLRITYAWCLEDSLGVLTVENLLDGWLAQAEFLAPLAIPESAFPQSANGSAPDSLILDPDVAYAGLSDEMEPVGLQASIGGGALVATDTGLRPIEAVQPGDRVATRDNGFQPVRWVIRRSVPAVGGFSPIRLRAPYFGLTRDLVLSPDQRVLFEGASVEYLFGEEEMFVEARHLVDGRAALLDPGLRNMTYYQLLLDDHEVISVGGLELESLFVGDIRDDPALLRTTLLAAVAPDRLPRHARVARPQLRAYEAPTLRYALSA